MTCTAAIRKAIRAALSSRVSRAERCRARVNASAAGYELHPAGEDDWSGEDMPLSSAISLVTPATRSMHVDVYTRNGLPGGGGDELDRGYYVRVDATGAVSVVSDY